MNARYAVRSGRSSLATRLPYLKRGRAGWQCVHDHENQWRSVRGIAKEHMLGDRLVHKCVACTHMRYRATKELRFKLPLDNVTHADGRVAMGRRTCTWRNCNPVSNQFKSRA